MINVKPLLFCQAVYLFEWLKLANGIIKFRDLKSGLFLNAFTPNKRFGYTHIFDISNEIDDYSQYEGKNNEY